mmetsp:Transcript_25774/g.60428  ORF Transcript_25774/g.60428 Transcript_25774/m.60428 type:complete len:266 (+) Transcript_25774:181-978(+)|eukprot:CAMPEP_0197183890 /NCGR_PEP_ID=MMETSP1423-20130617/8713_1 /TAXON_ID=476441 /ORGANISM="Pseudo-nitzschia heimii, Strain UNC1101" /LENGTH=265 /DNA_ID=CAMNT_0042634557 /DNA_START=107 /DNA_END=904 /DNA_ORIENTATION=-
MSDDMGGSSTEKAVPAWKLRQQQKERRKPPCGIGANDELASIRSSNSNASRRRVKKDLDVSNSSRQRVNDELNGTNSSSRTEPGWKLREREKARRAEGRDFDDNKSFASMNSFQSTGSCRSFRSRTSVSSVSSRHVRAVSRVPGPDPHVPSAFRSAFERQQQRKKSIDDFHSLSSVHSRSRTDACSTLGNTIGSDSSLSDDGSFGDEDSFASLDSDADEDDEAYRESRNQMRRLSIEQQDTKRKPSRFKKKTTGRLGTPLDLIAE